MFLDPALSLSDSEQLSIDELERQFSSIDESYGKSSAGRQLARHFVIEKSYGKAADYYKLALAAEGLSELANREIRLELASVYLLQKNFTSAANTIEALLNERSVNEGISQHAPVPPTTFIMLARAYSGLGNHLKVVTTLEGLRETHETLTDLQLTQLLALYYKAGSYPDCEWLLLSLINRDPQKTRYWQQLTSIYLVQKKYKPALDQLELARLKKIAQRPSDIKLLAELYVANGAAEKGARLLADALNRSLLDDNEENNIRLFEYWLQAREKGQAMKSLQAKIVLIKDVELHLQLAQLQMEANQWAGMQATVENACLHPLDDKFVSRANLLLGVSYLKQGNSQKARKSFINATLIAGEGAKAVQWLSFIDAETPTDKELSRISKPCRPRHARVKYVSGLSESTKPSATEADSLTVRSESEQVLELYEMPAQTYFTTPVAIKPGQIAKTFKSGIFAINIALVKAGGSSNGPVQVLLPDGTSGKSIGFANIAPKVKLAQSYTGLAQLRNRYKQEKLASYKALRVPFKGAWADVIVQVNARQAQAEAAGYELSGDNRLVLDAVSLAQTKAPDSDFKLEILIGVR